jgi:ABC-type bacteriocin/lantibiotic exporter with double-glycine peptidase domain
MAQQERTVIRFDNVSFEYSPVKPILSEVSFSLRLGAKVTVMGQNGAGKSTLFGLITGGTYARGRGDTYRTRGNARYRTTGYTS